MHKIESAGNIKKEEARGNRDMKQILEPKNSHNKMVPKPVVSANQGKK